MLNVRLSLLIKRAGLECTLLVSMERLLHRVIVIIIMMFEKRFSIIYR
jgi:hypothetical protein